MKRVPSVVNGAPISIRQAPWQVYVESTTGTSGSACGGSIYDADTIVTAAHCVFTDAGFPRPPAGFDVVAGVSNLQTPAAGDEPQVAGVTSIRVHPGYNAVAGAGSPDDVATLQLDAPLILGRATARAIPLRSAAPAIGSLASLTGYGQQNPAADANGQLYGLATTIDNPLTCGGPANALYLCIGSSIGSSCRGDSGGPMTQNAALIGVASFVTGPDVNSICRPGSLNGYTNVTAGEINAFIRGNDAPPPAPRGGTDVSGGGTFESGGSLTCSPGSWSNKPTFTYTIIDTENGQVLQFGASPTYRFGDADVGRRVTCLVLATTPGGTGIALTEATPAIARDPTPAKPKGPLLAVTKQAARRSVRSGGRVSFAIRVSNRGGARARGVLVCDTPGRGLAFTGTPKGAKRANGRVCWSISSLSAETGRTLRITMRAARVSRTRTVINRATARANNAQTLRRDAVGVRVLGAQGSRRAPPVTGPYLGF
ncbi:MAG: trypsin-like serine protease [Actinomycetota bacterium]|nr:trypsin-like serine protease [Actinomycetota bacterium]